MNDVDEALKRIQLQREQLALEDELRRRARKERAMDGAARAGRRAGGVAWRVFFLAFCICLGVVGGLLMTGAASVFAAMTDTGQAAASYSFMWRLGAHASDLFSWLAPWAVGGGVVIGVALWWTNP